MQKGSYVASLRYSVEQIPESNKPGSRCESNPSQNGDKWREVLLGHVPHNCTIDSFLSLNFRVVTCLHLRHFSQQLLDPVADQFLELTFDYYRNISFCIGWDARTDRTIFCSTSCSGFVGLRQRRRGLTDPFFSTTLTYKEHLRAPVTETQYIVP